MVEKSYAGFTEVIKITASDRLALKADELSVGGTGFEEVYRAAWIALFIFMFLTKVSSSLRQERGTQRGSARMHRQAGVQAPDQVGAGG